MTLTHLLWYPYHCRHLKEFFAELCSFYSVHISTDLISVFRLLKIWPLATLIEGSLLSIRLFKFWKSDKRDFLQFFTPPPLGTCIWWKRINSGPSGLIINMDYVRLNIDILITLKQRHIAVIQINTDLYRLTFSLPGNLASSQAGKRLILAQI